MDAEGRLSPVEQFLSEFQADRSAGRMHPLSHYLKLFPDHEEAVAREYLGVSNLDTAPKDRLGPYRLMRELGRGGQAVVYLAEDTRLGRSVALKVLQGLGPDAHDLKRRFHQGVEIASRLHHPHICAVYEADVHGSVPYIAMQFVEGEALSRRIALARAEIEGDDGSVCLFLTGSGAIAKTTPDLSESDDDETITLPTVTETLRLESTAILEVAQMIETLARTLHHAHERGVVHRDVKPANVMVTPDGRPILMDFDMARDDHPRSVALTQPGDAFGTPAYMAPEQIQSGALGLDRRADVWALGVTLFQCITLERPFNGTTREGVFRAILHDEPPRLRKLQPRAPEDLEVIVGKALEKRPSSRYQSALEMAEDLRRLLAHEPILARPATWWIKTRRYIRRRPRTALLVILGFLAAWALFWGLAERRQIRDLSSALDEARTNHRTLAAMTTKALLSMALSDGLRSEELLAAAPAERAGDDFVRWRSEAAEITGRLPAYRDLAGHLSPETAGPLVTALTHIDRLEARIKAH